MAKKYTAEQLQRLIDEGKLSWDDLAETVNKVNDKQREILNDTKQWLETVKELQTAEGQRLNDLVEHLDRSAVMMDKFVDLTKNVTDLNADNATYARAIADAHAAAADHNRKFSRRLSGRFNTWWYRCHLPGQWIHESGFLRLNILELPRRRCCSN